MFQVDCIRRALHNANTIMVEFDCCRYGCPYRKPTVLATNCKVLSALGKRCNCKARLREHLRGRVKIVDDDGKARWYWKTTLAGEYSGQLCHEWSELLQCIAPKSGHRDAREPVFLTGWLDEIRQVTRRPVPCSFVLKPCPSKFQCPWAHILDSWGTENKGHKEAAVEDGPGHTTRVSS